jgi:hypothetical protein
MGNTHGKEPWVKMPWVYSTFLVVLKFNYQVGPAVIDVGFGRDDHSSTPRN